MDIASLQDAGVIVRGEHVYVDDCVIIGRGVVLDDNVYIKGDTVIESGAHIGVFSNIVDSHIGKDTDVLNSQINNAYIGDRCHIGPYAHIHKGSRIGDNVRVGNFVEIKNSTIGNGSKMAHLAYIGDVDIGKDCNIGCGAIFVNYDGISKHRSTIGDGVFIGSNANVIAPVHVEDGAYLAAGSTLTCDLKAKDLCIARCREIIKPMRSKYNVR